MSSDRVRLRYTGAQATTFKEPGVGELQPGDGFEVPAGDAERFTRRADVERSEASEAASDSQDGEIGGGRRSGARGRSGSPKGAGDGGETAVAARQVP